MTEKDDSNVDTKTAKRSKDGVKDGDGAVLRRLNDEPGVDQDEANVDSNAEREERSSSADAEDDSGAVLRKLNSPKKSN